MPVIIELNGFSLANTIDLADMLVDFFEKVILVLHGAPFLNLRRRCVLQRLLLWQVVSVDGHHAGLVEIYLRWNQLGQMHVAILDGLFSQIRSLR